jgi:hypothetical protein
MLLKNNEGAYPMMKPLQLGLLFTLVAIAACAPRQSPPPPPAPPVAQPRPVQPPPPPPPMDWRDRALTPGGWTYRAEGNATVASFGGASFAVRCDRATRQVTLLRSGVTSGNMMTVRTSSTARNLPLSIQQNVAGTFTALPANDRLLDAIAFSRGRFTVEVPGTPMLVIPAWPEPARVVEDCRS